MIKFVCVKWGDKYNADYVNILYDMVRRNIAEGTAGKFICFTDNATGLDEGIQVATLPGTLEGWWNKLYLFKDGIFENGDRIIYLDLDTAIVSGIDDIIKYDGDFAILRDFYRYNGLQSSIMLWEAGKFGYLWDEYIAAGFPNITGGDQIWIEQRLRKDPDILQALYPKAFVSFKVHAQYQIPADCKIVVFHGEPRPHQVNNGWVPHIWKIGGGSSLEFASVGNVEEDTLIDNIRYSSALNLDWLKQKEAHDEHIVIVGGGCSISYAIDDIRKRAEAGQYIVSLNNSWRYLLEHGVKVDAQVMMDGRPDNISFLAPDEVTKYYASQCAPNVFQSAINVILWHHVNASYVLKDNPRFKQAVAGGSTVGLNAICIAYLLGYRKIHLYGFDSSYVDDRHHAYDQKLNDGENTIEVVCNDRKFITAPWMAEQVEQFKALMPQLCSLGCEITINGDGLLPYVASLMQSEDSSADGIVCHDGIYWPASDSVGRYYVQKEVQDIPDILAFVKERTICVQAGGNVGIWPKELSKHFNTVYTFEPDSLNFRCLALNCHEDNIIKLQAGLGHSSDKNISIEREAGNCGAHYAKPGGNIPVLSIDGLNLPGCDLIQLDIEGYEPFALIGAEQTIKKYRPIVVIEDKGLHRRYGFNDDFIKNFFEKIDYQLTARVSRDSIFTPK